MTAIDYQLEQLYTDAGNKPQRKYEETITSFDRDVFYYNRDGVNRQAIAAKKGTKRITYEDHRKVVEIAVNILRKSTQHDIALCILTHRYFADYRKNVFAGQGDFVSDYSYLIKRIGVLFDAKISRISTTAIQSKIGEFTKPTLVQVNHIVGTVEPVTTPNTGETLNEWAIKYNRQAPPSTTYRIAGLKVGI